MEEIMTDVFTNFLELIYNNFINPLFNAISNISPFDDLINFIATLISWFFNLFRETPVFNVVDNIWSLEELYVYSNWYALISQLLGIILIYYIFKIFFVVLNFLIDGILNLVKSIQREAKIINYLEGKKGGHKRWLKY